MIRLISIHNFLVLFLFANSPNSLSIGTFLQEQRLTFISDNGLPSNDIRGVASTNDGTVFVATAKGLIVYSNEQWITIDGLENIDIWFLASNENEVALLGGNQDNKMLKGSKIYIVRNGRFDQTIVFPSRYNIHLINNYMIDLNMDINIDMHLILF